MNKTSRYRVGLTMIMLSMIILAACTPSSPTPQVATPASPASPTEESVEIVTPVAQQETEPVSIASPTALPGTTQRFLPWWNDTVFYEIDRKSVV